MPIHAAPQQRGVIVIWEVVCDQIGFRSLGFRQQKHRAQLCHLEPLRFEALGPFGGRQKLEGCSQAKSAHDTSPGRRPQVCLQPGECICVSGAACLPIPNSSPELECPKPQCSGCKVHVQLEVSLLSPVIPPPEAPTPADEARFPVRPVRGG